MLRRLISFFQLLGAVCLFDDHFELWQTLKFLKTADNIYQQMYIANLNTNLYLSGGLALILVGLALSPFCGPDPKRLAREKREKETFKID